MIKFSQFLQLITEGGAGGRIPHPYELVGNGSELIDLFKNSINYITPETSSIKFDGINSALKVTPDGFAIDRGSSKDLDLKGVRPEDLEARFGEGHGMIDVGTKVISIFDAAYSDITPELNKLGLTKNRNLLLNVEYIDGKTNIIPYDDADRFIIIHGMKEMKVKNKEGDGKVKSRTSVDVEYDEATMQSLLKKLKPYTEKEGFSVLGLVGASLKKKPDLDGVLNSNLRINGKEKPLKDWVKNLSITKKMITRDEYKAFIDDQDNIPEKVVNDVIIYYTTSALGDEIKRRLDIPGNSEEQEGIIVNDPKYGKYKITGTFIVRGSESNFNDTKEYK